MDDAVIIESEGGMQSARQAFVLLHDLLRIELAADKAVPSRVDCEGQPIPLCGIGGGAARGVALGVEWDWEVTAGDLARGVLARVRRPEEKGARFQARAAAPETRGRKHTGEAAKISSTVDYWSSWGLSSKVGLSCRKNNQSTDRMVRRE